MIEVYSKQNFTGKAALKHNGDMVLTPYSCTVSIELGGAIVVEMEHPVDTLGRWKYIAEENVLVVDTPWAKRQAFRIWQVVTSDTKVKASAQHIIFDLKRTLPGECGDEQSNCYGFASTVLNTSDFSPSVTGLDTFKSFSCHYSDAKSAYDALLGDDESVIRKWSAEWLPDNFNVQIMKQLGKDRGLVLRDGVNASGVEFTVNTNDVVTSILPTTTEGIYNDELVVSEKEKEFSYPHIAIKSYYVSPKYTPQPFSIYPGRLQLSGKKVIRVNEKNCFYGVAAVSANSSYRLTSRYRNDCPFFYAHKDGDLWATAPAPFATSDWWRNSFAYSFTVPKGVTKIWFNIVRRPGSGMNPFKHSIRRLTNNDAAFTDIEDVIKEIRRLAALEFSVDRIDEPKINVAVDYLDLRKDPAYQMFQELEHIELGDTVTIALNKLGLSAKARVIKLEYDCLKHELTGCEIGSFKRNYYRRVTQRSYKAMQGIHQLNRDSMTADNTLDLIKAYTETEDDIE